MNKFFVVLIILVSFVFIISCKTSQAPISIINLDKAEGIKQYTNIYSLPKTVIRIKVSVEREIFVRGPYYQFAQAYLGLNNVIQENLQNWRISSIEFETYPVSDTGHLYLIETNEEQNPLQLNFDKGGFLESINDFNAEENQNVKSAEYLLKKQNISPDSNFAFDNDTAISFDDIPLPKAILAKKSISEQAVAFANTVLTLRDDRAAIIVGDGYTNALPEGGTLVTMIKNIDGIQEKYMSMFTGKIKRKTFNYYFEFIPEEPRKTTQAILFRFSEQTGIVNENDMQGMPVIIEIESFESLKEFEQYKKRQFYLEKVAEKEIPEKGFYYRMPELGIVRLLKNDIVLKQDKIQIAQYGSIQFLPFKYLNGDYTIKFFPDLGSINSITLNKKDINQKKEK